MIEIDFSHVRSLEIGTPGLSTAMALQVWWVSVPGTQSFPGLRYHSLAPSKSKMAAWNQSLHLHSIQKEGKKKEKECTFSLLNRLLFWGPTCHFHLDVVYQWVLNYSLNTTRKAGSVSFGETCCCPRWILLLRMSIALDNSLSLQQTSE